MPLTIIQSTVSQQLKERTLHEHQESEAVLLPRLTSIQSFEDYASILKMFYGFFHPLEKEITSYISREVLEDIHERRNSAHLLLDLKATGYAIDGLAICKKLPSIQSLPEALGAMYVLEGSTLGGRMISKMLMKNSALGLNEEHLHFFSGYKEQTGNKWTSFQSLLDQYEDEADAIVFSAKQAFDCFTKWMKEVL